ncbi:MAG: glycosyltransferase [Candidatus Absconditabacteria bacterium]|nr:glycosyltransferase [Candidatus Absconditabacteria bacterium]
MLKISERLVRKIKQSKMKYIDKGILKNVFGTRFSSKVLISYITFPFCNEVENPKHTNLLEAKKIAETFHELKYIVDVIDWTNKCKINYKEYDIIFGFGEPFEKAFASNNKMQITIAYLTFSNPYFANKAELERIIAFQKRKNKKVMLQRQMFDFMDLNINRKATAAICLGNEVTLSTYENEFENLYALPATGLESAKDICINRNLYESRYKFLWFSGSGAIHKGLDLCIEVFAKLPQCELYIAGPKDQDVFDAYQEELTFKNIHFLGKISVESEEYRDVCEKCSYSILPSCSEGQSTAVLTTMFSGLIPVVTKQCGIDCFDFGYEIKDISIDEMIKLVEELSFKSVKELEVRHEAAYKYVNNNHTLDKFTKEFEKCIDKIMYK